MKPTRRFKIGDKVKIGYISDCDRHNGKTAVITWLNDYKYYPNRDPKEWVIRTQAELTYSDGSAIIISNLYRERSGIVDKVRLVKGV